MVSYNLQVYDCLFVDVPIIRFIHHPPVLHVLNTTQANDCESQVGGRAFCSE